MNDQKTIEVAEPSKNMNEDCGQDGNH